MPVEDIVLSKSTLQPANQRDKNWAGWSKRLCEDVSLLQSTELIYCTALRVFPRQEREYPRRRYVNLSLTCLKVY